MNADVSLSFAEGDVDRLIGQMDRAMRELGITLKQAMTQAANRVALSLGKSTAVAPKYREFRDTGRVSGNRKYGATGYYFNHEYEVTSLKGGTRKTFSLWAKNKSEAKRDKRVLIGKRGLAKMAWRRAAQDIGADAGIGSGGASESAQSSAQRHASGYADYSLLDPFFRMTSELDYASKALIGETAGTVVSRAADAMAHIIENRLAKKYEDL